MHFITHGEDLEADAECGPDALELRPKRGTPLTIPYVDIDSARASDYRVWLTVFERGAFELFHLGKKYDGFCEELFERRNASLARELFLADRTRLATFKARIGGADGRVDLYPRTIVFYPHWTDPTFLRIAELRQMAVDPENYRITLDGIEISYLGLRFEEFAERLKRVRTAMEKRCAKMLEALVPGTGGLAPRLLDGMIDQVADRFEPLVRADEYAHLKRLATAPIWIGIKETGGDDLDDLEEDAPPATQHLIWYYTPVGPLSVHEVVSEEDHATYVWRAEPRAINRAWAMVQFRRQVLLEPEKFAAAYRKLPYLREVAGALAGRAIHNESWTTQLAEILQSKAAPSHD